MLKQVACSFRLPLNYLLQIFVQNEERNSKGEIFSLPTYFVNDEEKKRDHQ